MSMRCMQEQQVASAMVGGLSDRIVPVFSRPILIVPHGTTSTRPPASSATPSPAKSATSTSLRRGCVSLERALHWSCILAVPLVPKYRLVLLAGLRLPARANASCRPSCGACRPSDGRRHGR